MKDDTIRGVGLQCFHSETGNDMVLFHLRVTSGMKCRIPSGNSQRGLYINLFPSQFNMVSRYDVFSRERLIQLPDCHCNSPSIVEFTDCRFIGINLLYLTAIILSFVNTTAISGAIAFDKQNL